MKETVENNYQSPGFADRVWLAIKLAGGIIGLAASAITIYVPYSEWRSVPKIHAAIVDRQCMTRIGSMPDSECEFLFKGKKVENLWLIKLRLQNSCNRNIIGVSGGDLMYQSLNFRVSEGAKIVYADCEVGDIGGGGLGWTTNECSYSFEKWKPNQSCVVRLYCEGECAGQTSLSQAKELLKYGEVIFSEQKEECGQQHLIDTFPPVWRHIATHVGIISFTVILCFALWWLVVEMEWIRTIRRLMWNRKYFAAAEHLVQDEKNDRDLNISATINRMSKEYWVEHGFPPPPKYSSFVKGTRIDWSELCPPVIFTSVLCIISVIAIAALISLN